MAEEQTKLQNFQSKMSATWMKKIAAAHKAKEGFSKIAEMCRSFYSKDCGFMWKDGFRDEFIGPIEPPSVQVTINKAFDFVSIIGPYLFWQYPTVYVRPYEPIEIDPLTFGNPQSDPMVAQRYQMVTEMQESRWAVSKLRAALMERALNYFQREQRDPLEKECNRAIVDAMLTGRGVLWPEKYSYPASGRTLTGLFHGSIDDFFVDPDCCDPGLKTAKWIARRHVSPVYEVERKFGHKPGSLKKYASTESNDEKISKNTPHDKVRRENGQTHDRMVWYEIFSKGGVGTRQHDVESTLHDEFEDLIGDYAYIVVSPHCPFFLNASPEKIQEAEDDDEILEMLSWPYPCWMDGRWPVAILDFYTDSKSAWPIAPLAPAMGWLVTMNILVSAAVQNAYENRKQLVGALESVADQVEKALSSGSSAVVRVKESMNHDINKMVQYLNRPQMNTDIWSAIEYCSNEFNKATNLIDFMYAQSSTQDRSARSTAAKEEKSGVRPEKMSLDVAAWMSDACQQLKTLTAFEISGSDIDGLLGPVGSTLWDEYVSSADPEEVCREMNATCEASDMRRPNRERDAANMNNMAQLLLPVMQQVAAVRGDDEGIEPLNAFLSSLGKILGMDTTEWELPALSPPPDPMLQQLQQAMQQMEMEKTGAETASKNADAMKKTAEAQQIASGGQVDSAMRQQEFDFDMLSKAVDMRQAQQKHQMDMAKSIADFQFKGAQMRMASELKNQSASV